MRTAPGKIQIEAERAAGSPCPRRSVKVAVLAVFLIAVDMTGDAQGFAASLVGSVRDVSRAALSEATLTVENQDTGVVRTKQTQADGGFSVPHLSPGRYRVTVQAANFRTFVMTDVVLEADQVRRLDVSRSPREGTQPLVDR